MDSPGFRSSSTPLPRPLDQTCSFLEPQIPHLKRCSWTCRNIQAPATRSALRVLVLSFCARLTQLALVGGAGVGTEGHRAQDRCTWRLKLPCVEVKGSHPYEGSACSWNRRLWEVKWSEHPELSG